MIDFIPLSDVLKARLRAAFKPDPRPLPHRDQREEAMSSEAMYDLHRCERAPFPETTPDGAEPTENTYLERATVKDREEAVALLVDEYDMASKCFRPKPIHMRWVEGGAMAWVECPADHPDAVPFWKDAP